MNDKTIIELAKRAGINRRIEVFFSEYCDGICFDDLETFAKLVAAKEREECAKVVDHILKEGGGTYGDAIRARSKA